MATIKNTIAMQDKMTPVLRTIIKSMQSTVSAMAGVDKASNSAFKKAQKDVNAASDAVNKFNGDLDEIPPAANKATQSFARWKNPLVTAASAIYTIKAALQAVSKITDIADNASTTAARIGMMNDGLQTTAQLQDMIFASAQRSKASYGDTAAAVGKLGILAGDAFSSSAEIVAFSELMNKSFKIGGASIQEQASAMYQLTQAMAAGKLQGDEFRSIMENAPMLADAIAKFAGKTKGELKEMSSQGLITADMIKDAMFSSADEINEKFAAFPRTFRDVWTSVKNMTLKAFQPVINKLNEFANSKAFEKFAKRINKALIRVANMTLKVIEALEQIMAWVQENGPVIADIAVGVLTGIAVAYTAAQVAATLYAFAQGAVNMELLILNARLVLVAAMVAAAVYLWRNFGEAGQILAIIIGILAGVILVCTIAQYAFNTALWLCPVVWIIAAVIAIILVVLRLWKTNMDFKYGIIKIWNDILGFFDQVPIFFQAIGNGIADAFAWASTSVQNIVQGMANGVIAIINGLIAAINLIPGVAIAPMKQLTFAATSAAKAAANKQARDSALSDSKSAAASKAAARDAATAANRASDEAALAAGASAAEAQNKHTGGVAGEFDWSSFLGGGGGAAGAAGGGGGGGNPSGGSLDSIGKIEDDISITDEDIKLLKDIAATEFINKYTTLRPEMSVTFGDVRETADVNRILEVIEDMVESAYASSLVGGGA